MSQSDEDLDIEREERGIYAIITMASAPVVIGLAVEGGVFDGGSTLSLAMAAVGVVGLVAGLRAVVGHKLPRAIVHRDS
jgi:hypothetical protein